MIDEQPDFLIKIILIGDSGVGKTNLLNRYTKHQFEINTRATIGVDFTTALYWYKDYLIKIQFWDTAGQEKYKAITGSYYKQAQGAILVYDITNKKSFENLPNWQKDLKKTLNDKIAVLILGNKNDLEEQRQVTKEPGEGFASQNGYQFFETSTKDGQNIQNSFEAFFNWILDEQFKSIKENNLQFFSNFRSKQKETTQKEKKCC